MSDDVFTDMLEDDELTPLHAACKEKQ